MPDHIASDTPREQQTLRLSESKLASLRGWALDGTALTAAARVRDDAGRIALVKNGWSDGWIPPGGGVENGETPAEAAEREIQEETGLDATVSIPLVVFEQSYVAEGDGEEWFTAKYVMYDGQADGEIPDASRLGVTEDEISAARWFETVPENLHDGELLRKYL